MNDRVRVEVVDEVAHVTLDRPDKLNALDMAMMHGLVDAAKQVKADRSVRAVLLRGEGSAFCAGLDFASVGKQPAKAARGFVKLPGQTANLYQRACWAWRRLPVPVVAVVQGHCFGGGMQLALAADFRYTDPACEFSVMEAKWGLIPDMSGSVSLRELVPMDVAKRLTMTAEIIDGSEAKKLGLVTGVGDDPLAEAQSLIAKLMTRSPDAVAASKKLLQSTWHKSPRWAFWTESRLQLALMRGANFKIARKANLAQEPPRFRQRNQR